MKKAEALIMRPNTRETSAKGENPMENGGNPKSKMTAGALLGADQMVFVCRAESISIFSLGSDLQPIVSKRTRMPRIFRASECCSTIITDRRWKLDHFRLRSKFFADNVSSR